MLEELQSEQENESRQGKKIKIMKTVIGKKRIVIQMMKIVSMMKGRMNRTEMKNRMSRSETENRMSRTRMKKRMKMSRILKK